MPRLKVSKRTVGVTIFGVLTLLLTSSVVNNAVAVFVSGYNSPNFQVVSNPDFSSVSIQNIGHAMAHDVRIMVLLPGKQTSSIFSTENSSMQVSYDGDQNYTALTVVLKRMSEQAEVTVFFKSYPPTMLRIWIQSNEKGTYTVLTRAPPSVDPLHKILNLIQDLSRSTIQVSDQLLSFVSISFVVIFFALLFIVRWFLRKGRIRGMVWPFQ